MPINALQQLIKTISCSSRTHSLLALTFAAALSAGAVAQEYRSDTPSDEAKRNASLATASVKDAGRYSTDSTRVQQYFTQYYFPQMTQTSGDALAALGELRYNLFKRYLWATTNQALQRDLTNATLQSMGKIVTAQNPPYHPAVRYNAILTIGMLDGQYATQSRPPVPLAAATTALTKIVGTATTSDRFSPPVLLGALIGLERHAQYRDSLEPAAVNAMTAALVKLVTHEKPIQEMDRATYAWLRLQAADVLARLGNVGPNNAVHDALLKLTNELNSMDDRCSSAALFALLKYDGAKVDGSITSDAFMKLARELSAAEAKRAKEFEDTRVTGGAGGYASPGRERMMMMQQSMDGEESEIELYPRRLLAARLADLRSGLRATRPIVPKEDQAKYDAVLKAIEPVIQTAGNKESIELAITKAVQTMNNIIATQTAPAEKPAAEPDADAFSAK